MAQKDIEKKSLEELNDVFADIVNVLLFQGRRVIAEEELTDASPRSNYTAQGKKREQERDVAKFWKKHELRIALLGLENQEKEDPDMPLRVIGYDGAAYRDQIGRKEKAKERYPVITLVLHFGTKHSWSGAKSLHEYFDLREELRPYVSDYRMNVFDIAFLADEQVELFQSDFRIVADYFVQKRKNNRYEPSKQEIRHVSELLSLMSAVTNDNRYEEIQEEFKRKERTNMCEVIDYYINVGEERGMQQGIQQGIQKGIRQKELDDISKMAAYLQSRNASLTEEEAREEAARILR